MAKYLQPEDTVLVIIDWQEKLVRPMPNGKEATKNANILVAAANQFNMPIIVTEQYPQGLGSTVEDIKEYMKDEILIEKNTFSACLPEFEAALEKTGRKTIIIIGIETHVCVLQTVRDLLRLGYDVHVVNDAVCSRTKQNFKAGIKMMAEMGATITTTEIAAFDLMKKSGTPEFKVLSKLIK